MMDHKSGVFILLISCCCLALLVVGQYADPSEVDALMAVKKRLNDPMKNLKNWGKGDPCSGNWTGIVCSNVTTDGFFHVQKLNLLNSNLTGTLAPELGQLSQLQILDFMWNELTGSIPKEIGNISNLTLLLLNGNKLSGSLPEELGNLKNLNRLQLDQNLLSGPIPKSFANLNMTKHLHLNNNSFSGQLPPELSRLSGLLHLLVDNNNLSGYLPPEFSTLPKLHILQLDNNNFEGTSIPASYGSMANLVKLSLRNCSLQGNVPDLSAMPHLRYIDLSFNQLTGSIPATSLSKNITTIKLSNNYLNGTIPSSFSRLPLLQILSVENNMLTGSVPTSVWQNMTFDPAAKLTLDLQNNSLSSVVGSLNPPVNVTLRLYGNPICRQANIPDIKLFCLSETGKLEELQPSVNTTCPVQACPVGNFFEYVPDSPEPCFCASPIRIGYRLKSPSFSYFPPYMDQFETYVTTSLQLKLHQLLIESYAWEEGPRLRMHVKLFPVYADGQSSTFNVSEVQRLRRIFISWNFPTDSFYGPYELLNFTLLGPYAGMDLKPPSSAFNKTVWISVILACVVCAVVITSSITFMMVRRYSKQHRQLSRTRISSKISMKIDGVKSFTFKELSAATENFNCDKVVGQGGYGKVYKGILPGNVLVAVKRTLEGSLQGQKEFLTEIELLSRVHHLNLVSLLGYCDEEDEQMLVYEFMSNGSLRDWISGKAKGHFGFRARLQIALGASKGILYLHTEAQPPIFHRDIKASNILLDSKFIAKVADFGLSRLAPVLSDEGTLPNHISTVVKGTPGYLDPEYFLTHKLTDKSDVYSLGVVFLELLTGMQPIYHGKNIVREVNFAVDSGMMFSIIDSKMGSYPSENLEKFVTLALNCSKDKPENRPSMLDVVRELENILKTMPGADPMMSETSSSSCSGKSGSQSTPSSFLTRDPYGSFEASLSTSHLVSDVFPTIRPK
uniref:non-specific serine/threonine protein kinase n=1 Tax=Sedum alfredii TaxID=439688 RepID=A0A410N697_9MAGN|nr:LRR receptor-like serine/threonine-protein kinase [Sedum alfredii]